MDDELLGDMRRSLGEAGMGSFLLAWRRAIHLCRPAAAHALEAVKLNRPDVPGGYMAVSFLNDCRKRGVRVPADLFARKQKEAAR